MRGVDIERERKLLRDRLLGRSPECEAIDPGVSLGLDLRFAPNGTGLDLAQVKGIDALTQALRIAITTRLNDDIFNTQFGFDGLNAMAEETNHILVRERIRIAIIQVLRREPRIRRIIDVKLSAGQLELAPDGTFIGDESISDDEKARQRRELNVSVAFETITGDQTTIQLGALGSYG